MPRRATAVLAAAVLVLLSALVLLLASTSSAAPRVVQPGSTLTVDVGGFAGGTVVHEQLAGILGAVTQRADARGRVHVEYRVPRRPGLYRLLISGRPRGLRAPTVGTSGPGDVQVVQVVVPLLVRVDFRVAAGSPSLGVSGVSTSAPGGGGSSGGNGTDGTGTGTGGPGTAGTGVDVLTPFAIGMLAIVVGAGAIALGRRRRPREH